MVLPALADAALVGDAVMTGVEASIFANGMVGGALAGVASGLFADNQRDALLMSAGSGLALGLLSKPSHFGNIALSMLTSTCVGYITHELKYRMAEKHNPASFATRVASPQPATPLQTR